ncbi:MAG: hypothetical protein SGI72_13815 [Planctomycetota bacterium]|nr:hypothetical protein [Planctomycetota bacterium]
MNHSSEQLRERLVNCAWSAWSALGVAGWNANSFAGCIDIDALVLLTGRLGDTDARMRDESIDWCVSNLALVSRSRLAHLLNVGQTEPGWSMYAATLQRATKQRWPGSSTPFEWSASHKSRTRERSGCATLALRCRALFGATARSEIVRILLLQEHDAALDARNLAVEAAYTKRSISDALDNLRIAGLVESTTVGNSHRYRFERPTEVEALLGPLPSVRSSQRALTRAAWAILRASEESATAPERVRRVEAARVAAALASEIWSMESRPDVLDGDEPSFEELVGWCSGALDRVCPSPVRN